MGSIGPLLENVDADAVRDFSTCGHGAAAIRVDVSELDRHFGGAAKTASSTSKTCKVDPGIALDKRDCRDTKHVASRVF